MTNSNRVEVKLIEFESMLHASVQRVGRTVRNLRQEMGGYGSKTPGSGEPGAGKNSRATVWIADPSDPVTHEQLAADSREVVRTVVEDGSFAVPVTPVEVQALGLVGHDVASLTLDELRVSALTLMNGLRFGPVELAPADERFYGELASTSRLVVFCYYRTIRWRRHGFAQSMTEIVAKELDRLDPSVGRIYSICQKWGYTPGVPNVSKDRAELLAVDLTEQWCTSHLRAGARRKRSRGELCDWCYRHGPLLAATWDAPPLELVRLHIDHGKVYAHEVEPFLRAERDRQRNRVKAAK